MTVAMLRDDVIERITDRIVRGPFGEHLGFSAENVEEDHVVVKLAGAGHVMNGGGVVHGGATSALVDTAATAAAWATDRAVPGTRGTTVGFSVNFLARSGQGDLMADARVVRRGGRLTVLDVVVRNGEGDVTAKAQVTYMINLGRNGD